jgi:hypothetical protein
MTIEAHSKEGLLQTFENFKKALFKCNRDKLDHIIARDYRGYSIYGLPEDREMILKAYGQNGVTLEKYDVQDMHAEVIGEIGIITGRGFIRGTYQGIKFEHHVSFLDIYRFRQTRWQLYLTHDTEIKEVLI